MKLGSYFLIALAIILSGCAHQASIGNKFDSSMIYKIKTGASTKEDVLSFLGTPFGKNTRPDGTSMWSYQFIAVSNQSTAMALIPVVGPLMDAFEGQHMERTTQNLTVTFNKPGIVTACTYKTSSRKSEGGLGMMGNGGETVEMRCEDAK